MRSRRIPNSAENPLNGHNTSLNICLVVLFSAAMAICSSSCQVAATQSSVPNRNEIALRRANESIERNRKGDVRIRVADARGNPAPGIRIRVNQVSHDFKFGCYLKLNDLASRKSATYQELFSKLFNYAVIGTYWDFIENQEGNPDWSWFDRESTLARKLGAEIQAAPVLWGTNESGTPKWLPKKEDRLIPILKDHVQSALNRNPERIDDWEIVNEPLSKKRDVFAERIGGDYVASAFAWAREAAPTKRLIINEYGVFGSDSSHNYNRDKYRQLLNSLIERNVPIDVIGIQAHANGEWYEPANVAEQLDRYAELGKPIQITEFSSQLLDYDDRKTPMQISGTYKSGVWDAEKQAAFYREFYTIAFGSPQVEAIVTWGLDDERAWLPGIGLVDKSDNPKPVYESLDSIINTEWRTSLEDVTDENGVVDLRGFFGRYHVQIIDPKWAQVGQFSIEKGKANNWVFRLKR
ncbi:MAG: endo-1,4-beta-xylanase [Pyrinomonadaceae bacterium]